MYFLRTVRDRRRSEPLVGNLMCIVLFVHVFTLSI